MIKYASFTALIWLLIAPLASAQQAANRVELGRLSNGAAVAFVRAGTGDWGIQISGGAAPAHDAAEARADRGLSRRGQRNDLASGYGPCRRKRTRW